MKTFKEFLSILEAHYLEKRIPLGKGQTYGSPEYQDELQRRKAKARKDAEERQKQTSSELYQERTRGRGIRATQGGVKGWIKSGKFTPGTW